MTPAINVDSAKDTATLIDEGAHAYTICNGLGNQLLAHAGNIAYAITNRKVLLIPDAYIVNGVQDKRNTNGHLLSVTPSNSAFVKLSDIFDTNAMLDMVESHGIKAVLVQYNHGIHGDLECSWLKTMSSAGERDFDWIESKMEMRNMMKQIIFKN